MPRLDDAATGYVDALWGKEKNRDPAWHPYHPLLFHMLDTAAVAHMLFARFLAPSMRTELAAAWGCSQSQAQAMVAWLAAVHDIGKASPMFARLVPSLQQQVTDAGLRLDLPTRGSHEEIGAGLVAAHLRAHGWPRPVAEEVACAVSLDGGLPPGRGVTDGQAFAADPQWAAAHEALFDHLRAAVNPPLDLVDAAQTPPHLLVLLAGLVKVADWVASNGPMFPFTDPAPFTPRSAYWGTALMRAARAVRRVKLGRWVLPSGERSWDELLGPVFGGGSFEPRPLQVSARALSRSLFTGPDGRPAARPGLMIVEDVMGSGKTEAAWVVAHDAVQAGHGGVYVGLPTRATSDQAYRRLRKWFAGVFPGQRPMLTHALWRNYSDAGSPMDGTPAERSEATEPSKWFRGYHRSGLSAVAVGTVDQPLGAALAAKYQPVRMLGLHHRVLVVDEMHAYDRYMCGLVEVLLTWLARFGAPVVIMSATLPTGTRARLVAAYKAGLPEQGHGAGVPGPDAPTVGAVNAGDADCPSAAYPRITVVDGDGLVSAHTHASSLPARDVHIRWKRTVGAAGAQQLAADLAARVSSDRWGRVGVVCNTVTAAQNIAAAIRDAIPYATVDLLHARFTVADRADAEDRALAQHDKNRPAARRENLHILVGTQVIEQSLDLDFDILISEFAPADLLLQRFGRLWRWWAPGHVTDPPRPSWATRPEVWISDPTSWVRDLDIEIPQFAAQSGVYTKSGHRVLWATYLTWRGRNTVNVPGDLDGLVQAAYETYEGHLTLPWQLLPQRLHPATADGRQAWEDAWNAAASEQRERETEFERAVMTFRARPPDEGWLPDWRNGMSTNRVDEGDDPISGLASGFLQTRLSDTRTVTLLLVEPGHGQPVGEAAAAGAVAGKALTFDAGEDGSGGVPVRGLRGVSADQARVTVPYREMLDELWGEVTGPARDKKHNQGQGQGDGEGEVGGKQRTNLGRGLLLYPDPGCPDRWLSAGGEVEYHRLSGMRYAKKNEPFTNTTTTAATTTELRRLPAPVPC